MNGIREWLHTLGLGEYAELFEREQIDLETVRHLSDVELKELGLPIGPRVKLRTAIQKLDAAPAQHEAPPQSAEARREPATARAGRVERRQLTVMFCDLVGSTSLSEGLDPEELRELMRAYQAACGNAVARFEGHVAQYLGDGLMVYFGWPKAHEDDAERAVRAGLDIIRAVKTVPAPSVLRVRIGIATGQVVVGETGDGDASVPKMAVGETPNLAARLQALAGPDEIVIAPTTQRLVGATFKLEDLGEHVLRGILERVRASRVHGESGVEDRFEASHGMGITPLVGRESELSLLIERWRQAADGEGQVVVLSGEPGIGKSRIMRALRAELEEEAHFFIRYQCSPFFANTAFYPVIEELKRAAGFVEDDPSAEKLTKLEALFGRAGGAIADAVALHAALLSVPLEGRYPPIDLPPRQQNERIIEATFERIRRTAAARPVLVVFEDVHWIDPTTRELIDYIVARIAASRVLLVVMHRLEFNGNWGAHSNVTLHSLNRLSKRQCASLVARVSPKPLPEALVAQIVEKTDGVPLFVEELTKAVLESGLLVDAGERLELSGTSENVHIPATLHDSLMARLDRLLPVKEIAQIGAAIGREFSYQLLASVSPMREPALGQALESFVRSGLIYQHGSPPQAVYVFKHALVQDAAYDSLLKRKRAELHERIAEALETGFKDTETEPEIVAHHYSAADRAANAVPYWLRAGQNAMGRAAYREASAHLSRGLELLRTLAPGSDRDRREMELLLALGQAEMRGGESPRAMQAFEQAAAKAGALGAAEGLARAAVGFAEACWRPGLPDPTPVRLLEQANQALGESETELKVNVLAWLGTALATTGAFGESETVGAMAEAMAERLGITAMLAPTLFRTMLGGRWKPELVAAKLARAQEATRVAQGGEGDGFFEMLPSTCAALASLGDMRSAAARVDELALVAERQRQPFYLYFVTSCRSAIAFFEGRFGESETLAAQALRIGSGLLGLDPNGLYSVQMFSLRREQGRLGEVAPLLRQFVQTTPAESAWRPGLALAYAELDMLNEARAELEQLARDDFLAVPEDSSWLNCIAMLAEVCHKLGNVHYAEALYRLLSPYMHCNIVAPPLIACYGATARHLGMLATTMRRWDEAERHFEISLESNARQGGRPWIAHTQHAFAAMLLARARREDVDRALVLNAEAIGTARDLGMNALAERATALQKRLDR